MDVRQECPSCGEIFSAPEIILVECPKCENVWLVEDISPLELFAGYLHEIRHPYASLKGFTELLKNRQLSEAEQDKWLASMSQIIEELENLRQLLLKYIAKERKIS